SISSIAVRAAIEWFDDYSRAIRQHFGYALHYFVRIVACANNGIRADFRRVLDQDVERFAASFFTELGEERNVAPNQCLQARANRTEYRAGADGNATHDAQVPHNAETG